LLREYTLDRLNGPGNANHQQLDIAAVERARRRVVAAVAAWSAANGTSGRMHADVSMDIAADDVAGFGAVSQVIAAAEQRSIEGFLLTAPAVPEIVALRSWLFGQILAQLGGAAPVPWTFPDQPLAPTARAPVEVDLSWVQNTDRVLVVADDTNRILAVSNTAADILGWAHDELAGQRLTVIIPPDQREAHVAGFTRQLVTGQGRLLDQEVALSALHRNGHTVPVWVTLTRQLCDDRMVFVALLRPQ
jgi:PAS domain S-box-containing protein